jgi:hypothetical protein
LKSYVETLKFKFHTSRKFLEQLRVIFSSSTLQFEVRTLLMELQYHYYHRCYKKSTSVFIF